MKHSLLLNVLLVSAFVVGSQPAEAARKPRPGATATPSPSPAPSPTPSPTATSSPTQSTNLLTNPGFESGTTGWDIWQNTAVVTGQSQSGTYAIRTGTASGGFGQNILSKVIAGKSYRLTVYGRANSTAEMAAVNVVIKNSSGVALVSKQVIFDSSVYKQYVIDFTMPSGATSALVSFWKSTASTYYAYLDNFSLTAVGSTTSPSPTPTATVAPSPVPTVAPSPSPTSTSTAMNALGTQLWMADHETGSQSQWTANGEGGEYNTGTGNSAVSTLASRSGGFSLRMDIDTTTGLMHGTRNYRFKEPATRMDLIHTVYYYFPTKIDLDPNNSWINIQQWKAVKFAEGGQGTGPDLKNTPLFALGLGVRGGAGTGGANYLNFGHLLSFWGGTSVFFPPLQRVDLPVGQWVKVQIRYIQSRTGTGRVMIWQNDILLWDIKNVTTLPPEVDVVQWSVNNYADRTYPIKSTIFIDDVSIHLPK